MPGFRTRASKYWVGAAPTSRAKCRVCKQCVVKGETRLVSLAFVCPGKSVKLVHHARCVTRKLAKAVLAACGSVNGVPMSDSVCEKAKSEMRARLVSLTT